MKQIHSWAINATVLLLTLSAATSAEDSPKGVAEILNSAATINLKTPEDEQEDAYASLLAESEALRERNSDDAKAWIATAIVRASYARTQGMSALGLLKTTRKELEESIDLDEQAFGGYAHAFLGRLYFAAPAWPLSFGSNKRARRHLERALEINADTLENQFYYALFLADRDEHEEAEQFFLAARKSEPIIPAQEWRQNLEEQIDDMLATVREEVE